MSLFSETVAEERRRQGMEQRTLAAALAVSPQYLCDIEAGRRAPPIERIPALALELGVDPDWLYYCAGVLPPDLQGHRADGEYEIRVLQAFRWLRWAEPTSAAATD